MPQMEARITQGELLLICLVVVALLSIVARRIRTPSNRSWYFSGSRSGLTDALSPAAVSIQLIPSAVDLSGGSLHLVERFPVESSSNSFASDPARAVNDDSHSSSVSLRHRFPVGGRLRFRSAHFTTRCSRSSVDYTKLARSAKDHRYLGR